MAIIQEVITLGKVFNSHALIYPGSLISSEITVDEHIIIGYGATYIPVKASEHTNNCVRFYGLSELQDQPMLRVGTKLKATYDTVAKELMLTHLTPGEVAGQMAHIVKWSQDLQNFILAS